MPRNKYKQIQVAHSDIVSYFGALTMIERNTIDKSKNKKLWREKKGTMLN